MSTNFELAPLPKTVDGLLAVPMDIQTINAALSFDGAASTGKGDATINFITGPQAGNAVFDLRQTITAAWLDGISMPVAQLSHHDFGGGAGAEMRIIESVLPANSAHSLRVTYSLGIPQASTAGGYQPNISWTAGPRLLFNFGFTDLGPGRYLESWIPANLIFDQFDLSMDVQVINTPVVHTLITNGTATSAGVNHWTVIFPTRFTALSTLLEVRATDSLVFQTGTVTLPVSGLTVTLEAYKLVTGTADLTVLITALKTFLIDNENNYGPYIHGPRFVVFILAGGMEYEGGTTATGGSLRHETFHSWFARGLKPATAPDGWYDEAFTSYHDSGATGSLPFDFTAAPVLLCTQNQWSRITPLNAYSDGERFWEGLSALLGNSALKADMRSLFIDRHTLPITTTGIEEYLVSKSGNALLVDAFHKFVFGFSDPSPAPDLWIRDDAADPGADYWGGAFWNSPDLWIRNHDDGGTTHQDPEYGQDNWFYARIRNKSGSGVAKHFLVSFNAKSFAGTEFIYPSDFLPCVNAATGFDLAPGASTIVKAKWPANNVPPPGTHSCLLVSAIARSSHPVSGRHVWEHNNLAQKNLTIVDLAAGDFIIVPFLISNFSFEKTRKFRIELKKRKDFPAGEAGIIHQPSLIKNQRIIKSVSLSEHLHQIKEEVFDCGGHDTGPAKGIGQLITSKNFRAFLQKNQGSVFSHFPETEIPALLSEIKPGDQALIALKVNVPASAKKDMRYCFDVVQRDDRTRQIIGGITLEICVKGSKAR